MRFGVGLLQPLVVSLVLCALLCVSADASAAARARARVWPANNHCVALPTVADWTTIIHLQHADTTRVSTILGNRGAADLRFASPYVRAQALAWAAQSWHDAHPNPNTAQNGANQAGPMTRLIHCMQWYVTHTVHPALAANPSGVLSAVTAAIDGAPSPAGVNGVGAAFQLRAGDAPGGAASRYEACDAPRPACRAAAQVGDLPLMVFANAVASVAQVWLPTLNRGAWFACATPVGHSLFVRVVPAAGGTQPGVAGGAAASFLPWQQNRCTYTIVAANAVTAWTSPLSGCQVYVAARRDGGAPMLIHCNAQALPDAMKVAAMDTGAAEIVRQHQGYARAYKFTRAQYFDAGVAHFHVTPYGVRTRNGAGPWQWTATVIGPHPDYRARKVPFQRWR